MKITSLRAGSGCFKIIFILFSFIAFVNLAGCKDYYKLGNEAYEKGNFKKAIEYYSIDIQESSNPYVLNKRGTAFSEIKKYNEAIADFTEAIRIKPDFAAAYYNRANVYYYIQKYDEAIADCTKSIQIKPDEYVYFKRGLSFFMTGKYDEAIADYTKAIELKPDNEVVYYNRGLAYFYIQKNDEAIADCTKAIELKPDYGDAYFNRGLVYFKLRKYDESIADYIKAGQFNPGFASIYDNAAYAYLAKKDYFNAEINFRKCVEIDSEAFDAMLSLSILYYEKHNDGDAMLWMNKAIATETKLSEGMAAIEKMEKSGLIYSAGEKENLKKIFKLVGR